MMRKDAKTGRYESRLARQDGMQQRRGLMTLQLAQDFRVSVLLGKEVTSDHVNATAVGGLAWKGCHG